MTDEQLEADARAWLTDLKHAEPAFFWRVCEAAHAERRFTDIDGVLRDTSHIVFTDEGGRWLEGRRELIVRLTERDPKDDMEYLVRAHVDPRLTALSEAA